MQMVQQFNFPKLSFCRNSHGCMLHVGWLSGSGILPVAMLEIVLVVEVPSSCTHICTHQINQEALHCLFWLWQSRSRVPSKQWTALGARLLRLKGSRCPGQLLVSVAERKNSITTAKDGISRRDGKSNNGPVVLPCRDRVSHRLKKPVGMYGVQVVFSAPNKLGSLCKEVNRCMTDRSKRQRCDVQISNHGMHWKCVQDTTIVQKRLHRTDDTVLNHRLGWTHVHMRPYYCPRKLGSALRQMHI